MDKARIGFIGVGGIGSLHLQHVHSIEEAEIVAVCDINEENAAKKHKNWAYPLFTRTLMTFLKVKRWMVCSYVFHPFRYHGVGTKLDKYWPRTIPTFLSLK
jgi:predicted dehydrogenase